MNTRPLFRRFIGAALGIAVIGALAFGATLFSGQQKQNVYVPARAGVTTTTSPTANSQTTNNSVPVSVPGPASPAGQSAAVSHSPAPPGPVSFVGTAGNGKASPPQVFVPSDADRGRPPTPQEQQKATPMSLPSGH